MEAPNNVKTNHERHFELFLTYLVRKCWDILTNCWFLRYCKPSSGAHKYIEFFHVITYSLKYIRQYCKYDKTNNSLCYLDIFWSNMLKIAQKRISWLVFTLSWDLQWGLQVHWTLPKYHVSVFKSYKYIRVYCKCEQTNNSFGYLNIFWPNMFKIAQKRLSWLVFTLSQYLQWGL